MKIFNGFVAASLLVIFGTPVTAHGALGSCEYRLYSEWLGRSLLVCQTADEVDQCGIWPRLNPDAPLRGHAVGKSSGMIEFRSSECDPEKAVAVCLLPTSTVYFYEGDPKELASGCTRMNGEFKAEALELKAVSEALP